jgi:glycosyltransferase involved in cell wall biosynthesis
MKEVKRASIPSIRLVMVVKDEAHVIKRCLESVKPLIDSYCIVIDDSTTDNTLEVIRDTLFPPITGCIYRKPWVNFGVNRSEVIQLAYLHPACPSDYLLMMDADDILEGSWPKDWNTAADTFELKVNYNGISYWRQQIFRNDESYKYIGAVHEYLTRIDDRSSLVSRLDSLSLKILGGGSSWRDPDKYSKHAELCLSDLQKDPTNTRAAFYLAQSLKDAGMLEKALLAYQRRVDMGGGFAEEIYISMLEIAKLRERLNAPDDSVVSAYRTAIANRYTRIEARRELARFFRARHNWPAALVTARPAYELNANHTQLDSLFVEDGWKIIDEYALAAFYSCMVSLAKRLNEEILARDDLPDLERPRIQKNLDFCNTGMSILKKITPQVESLTLRTQLLTDSGEVLYSFDHKLGESKDAIPID